MYGCYSFLNSPLYHNKITTRGFYLEKIVKGFYSMKGYKIFIDPGHNATHTGASGNGLIEHQVVLDIANACNAQLQAYGATTRMSRTNHDALDSDYNRDLAARVNMSNNFGATIFVSIHNNNWDTAVPNGVETYVRSGASNYTKDLAARVNSMLASRTGMAQRDPAVKEANYRVIDSTNKAWAILTEVGFLSNAGDAGKLNTLAKRQTAGKAIADAIRTFTSTLPPIQ